MKKRVRGQNPRSQKRRARSVGRPEQPNRLHSLDCSRATTQRRNQSSPSAPAASTSRFGPGASAWHPQSVSCQTPRHYSNPLILSAQARRTRKQFFHVACDLYTYSAPACLSCGVTVVNFPGPGKHMVKVKGRYMFETSRLEPMPS